MYILPAIDIKNGECVRLYKGDFDTVHKVADNAIETALNFKRAGAKIIHMVDLDGALDGKPSNFNIFKDVYEASKLFIEVGGGIRDLNTVNKYLENGISRVILGSIALKDPDFVKECVKNFGNKIAVGIDAKDRKVATSGWIEKSDMDFIEFAKIMESVGVDNIIFTDISKDGTLEGPNISQLSELKDAVKCKITASGGIRDIENIKELNNMNLYGAICGKSIYSKTLDLKEAINITKGE